MRDLTPNRNISFFCLLACAGLIAAPSLSIAAADRSVRWQDVSLYDGQIILTESGDAISALMSLIPREFYPFSHSGIIAIEAGEVVVYEARGAYKVGGGTPADDWFKDESGIRRSRLKEYLERENYAVVYDPPPGADASKIVAFVRRHYDAETRFDSYFDHRTKDALYCAELIHDALRAGGWRGVSPPVPIRANSSLQTILKWWGIETETTLPVGRLATRLRYRGELGDAADRRAALIFNAFKKEIHRRFTSDQKLGNIFGFTKTLKFREPLRRLLERTRKMIVESPRRTTPRFADVTVTTLANEMFGQAK